jgi:hypothetical protein
VFFPINFETITTPLPFHSLRAVYLEKICSLSKHSPYAACDRVLRKIQIQNRGKNLSRYVNIRLQKTFIYLCTCTCTFIFQEPI